MYVAGIDGGQSSSVCVLGDGEGNVLARVAGPPADLVGEPPGSRRQADVLDALIADARRCAGLSDEVELAAVIAGISGADPDTLPGPAPRTRNLQIVHDSEIAHAGAFGGASGILVIAGTGSVALGIDARGRRLRAGGWGYYFGDEGSAIWTARTALRFAMEEHDRGRGSAIETAALAFFALDSLRAVANGFARGAIERSRLAAFARVILDSAGADPAARLIVQAAARALAELAAIVSDRLGPLSVSYAGGMFTPAFTAIFREQVSALRPALAVAAPVHSPELGALALARLAAVRPAVR